MCVVQRVVCVCDSVCVLGIGIHVACVCVLRER